MRESSELLQTRLGPAHVLGAQAPPAPHLPPHLLGTCSSSVPHLISAQSPPAPHLLSAQSLHTFKEGSLKPKLRADKRVSTGGRRRSGGPPASQTRLSFAEPSREALGTPQGALPPRPRSAHRRGGGAATTRGGRAPPGAGPPRPAAAGAGPAGLGRRGRWAASKGLSDGRTHLSADRSGSARRARRLLRSSASAASAAGGSMATGGPTRRGSSRAARNPRSRDGSVRRAPRKRSAPGMQAACGGARRGLRRREDRTRRRVGAPGLAQGDLSSDGLSTLKTRCVHVKSAFPLLCARGGGWGERAQRAGCAGAESSLASLPPFPRPPRPGVAVIP